MQAEKGGAVQHAGVSHVIANLVWHPPTIPMEIRPGPPASICPSPTRASRNQHGSAFGVPTSSNPFYNRNTCSASMTAHGPSSANAMSEPHDNISNPTLWHSMAHILQHCSELKRAYISCCWLHQSPRTARQPHKPQPHTPRPHTPQLHAPRPHAPQPARTTAQETTASQHHSPAHHRHTQHNPTHPQPHTPQPHKPQPHTPQPHTPQRYILVQTCTYLISSVAHGDGVVGGRQKGQMGRK